MGQPGLAQHLIDEAGLAVIDVGDHSDVAYVGSGGGHTVL
jgi:hypothetical protein